MKKKPYALPMPSPPCPTIRIAVVEDDAWLREALCQEINQHPELTLLAAYEAAEPALIGFPELKLDVVLMDINLPGMNGVDCLRRLKAVSPDTQVLMLTAYEESEQIFNSLLAGASGYLLKRTPMPQILEAIFQVRDGGSPMSAHIARKVVQHFNQMGGKKAECDTLSPREREVLELLARGDAYKMIADKLSVSIETVRMNIKHIYTKLHVHSRGEAVAKYFARP
jgi:DNA-binding NarL/FixJ family response regulator